MSLRDVSVDISYRRINILYSLLCIVGGSLVYLILRNDIIFLEILGYKVSYKINFGNSIIEEFILYNLSDALWALSLMFYVSSQKDSFIRICGLLMPSILEIGQSVDIIPGTFDFIDLSIYLLISSLFLLQWKKSNFRY